MIGPSVWGVEFRVACTCLVRNRGVDKTWKLPCSQGVGLSHGDGGMDPCNSSCLVTRIAVTARD